MKIFLSRISNTFIPLKIHNYIRQWVIWVRFYFQNLVFDKSSYSSLCILINGKQPLGTIQISVSVKFLKVCYMYASNWHMHLVAHPHKIGYFVRQGLGRDAQNCILRQSHFACRRNTKYFFNIGSKKGHIFSFSGTSFFKKGKYLQHIISVKLKLAFETKKSCKKLRKSVN